MELDLPDDEHAFLRDLVKTSRQKTTRAQWVDRDGTTRLTVLSQQESVRLKQIATRLGTSPGEVLRRAAHIPVPKLTAKKSPPSEDDGEPAS